jgi:hypothetical protein
MRPIGFASTLADYVWIFEGFFCGVSSFWPARDPVAQACEAQVGMPSFGRMTF